LDFGVRIMMPSHFPAMLLMSAIAVGDNLALAVAADELETNSA
jgi:hypothetical protein